MAFGLGTIIGTGCTQLNASHCGNQAGDVTCEQRSPDAPYCNRCEAFNDGCVAQPVLEPGCGFGTATGSTGEPPVTSSSSSASAAASSSEGPASSGAVDSSSTGVVACGNGVIDGDEVCDGEMLPDDAPTCVDEGYGKGKISCREDCVVDYAECPGYVECGNGELAPGEECDGTNFGGMTCDDFPNRRGRGLACDMHCMFDIGACDICRENDQSCDNDEECCEFPRVKCGAPPLGMRRCCVAGLDCL